MLTSSGRSKPTFSQSVMSCSTPACRAIAAKWIGALVEPPMAVLTRMTFSIAALVMIFEGTRSSCAISTMRLPVS